MQIDSSRNGVKISFSQQPKMRLTDLIDRLLNPATFVGSVFAAAMGVGLVWLVTHVTRSARGWWQSVTQFRLEPPRTQSLQETIWDEPKRPRETRPVTAHEPAGHITLMLSSRRDWSPGPLEVVFLGRRISWLPGWFPFNVQGVRPRISCRGVGIDPQMGGELSGFSGGYLFEKAGAFRANVYLNANTFVPAEHEIKLDIQYDARLSFSGVVAVRVRVEKRWLSAYYPVAVTFGNRRATG